MMSRPEIDLGAGARHGILSYVTPGRRSAITGSVILALRLLGVGLTLVGTAVAAATTVIGVGFWLFPVLVEAVRAQAVGIANVHERRTGVRLRVPEPPAPELHETNRSGFLAAVRHTWALLSAGDTWRLLRWAVIDCGTGGILALLPPALVVTGAEGLVLVALWLVSGGSLTLRGYWIGLIRIDGLLSILYAAVIGSALMALGFLIGPWLLRLHGRWAAWLLGSGTAGLRERVDKLETSRAQTRDDAAAELSRIEREVHDATQSRLVAIGLTLGTAEAVMAEDPDKARELIAKARDDSTTALAELRDLMRGIRPPVLADRGLGAALESLALDAAITVTTHIDLPHRLDHALEAAAYFSVREMLTNAIKHGGASNVTIAVRVDKESLVITVADDGQGGATILPGHGLHGTRRRLAAFDGTMAIDSPAGGPTVVRIEVPCGS